MNERAKAKRQVGKGAYPSKTALQSLYGAASEARRPG